MTENYRPKNQQYFVDKIKEKKGETPSTTSNIWMQYAIKNNNLLWNDRRKNKERKK